MVLRGSPAAGECLGDLVVVKAWSKASHHSIVLNTQQYPSEPRDYTMRNKCDNCFFMLHSLLCHASRTDRSSFNLYIFGCLLDMFFIHTYP